MNPDLVLPLFLGGLLVGVCVWNVLMTGQIEKLKAANTSLIDDLLVAVKKIPKRDESGKFRKKVR